MWLLARRQTAGRGRRGRAWTAGQGNLTATLLLTLDNPPAEAAQLAFVAALAVGEMIDAYVSPGVAGFKWPNDILLMGRKAAGMLIESDPAPAGGLWQAVGIGVNLVDFPTDLERPATALAEHLRPDLVRPPSQDDALERLSTAFAQALRIWLAEGFAPIRQAWLARAVGMGGPCTARLPHETVDGLAEGLDADGALLLRLPSGPLRRITAGDVFFGTS